jgi:hypothetical protein
MHICSELNVDSALPYQVGYILTGEGVDFGLGGASKRFQQVLAWVVLCREQQVPGSVQCVARLMCNAIHASAQAAASHMTLAPSVAKPCIDASMCQHVSACRDDNDGSACCLESSFTTSMTPQII